MKRLIALVLALALSLTAAVALAKDVDKSKVIKILQISRAVDRNTDFVAGLLEEITGYKCQYDVYSDNNQLALEITSGTEYDLVQVDATMFQTFLGQGVLKDLTPALEAHPSVVEAIFAPCIQYASKDGGVYAIVSADDAVYNNNNLLYRSDIFEKHGYSEPKNIEELYNLLVAIKKDTGLIPLTASSSWIQVIASGFGLSYNLVVDEESGSIKSYLYQEGLKEYLAWLNKCYEEELIDVDLPVNNSTTVSEKMASGLAVMTVGGHGHTHAWLTALRDNGVADAAFKTIIELEDSNGKRRIATSNKPHNTFVIPASASDEEAIYTMGMIASRLDYDNYWIYNVGYEGVHYYKTEDGVPHPIQPAFSECFMQAHEFQIGRNQYAHPVSWMCRVQKTDDQWYTFYESNMKAAAYPFEGNPLSFANFDAYAQYSSALDTLCKDYFMQVIAGTESIDTYSDFVAEWESSGGIELMEGATEWYKANPELAQAGRSSVSPYAELFGYTFD